jgi:hypothetical protein
VKSGASATDGAVDTGFRCAQSGLQTGRFAP